MASRDNAAPLAPEQGETEDVAECPQSPFETTYTEELGRISAMLREFQSWELPLMSYRENIGRGGFTFEGFAEGTERAPKRKLEDLLADDLPNLSEPECTDRLAIVERSDEQDLLEVQAPPSKRQRTRMEEICRILSIGEEYSEASDQESEDAKEERGPVYLPEIVPQASTHAGWVVRLHYLDTMTMLIS
jgi:hypothetical protein